jgi:hypothetical protein
MQVTLKQAEIETAIRNYIDDQVSVEDGHLIHINLKATRGPEGYQAIVHILPEGEEVPVPTKAVRTPKVVDPNAPPKRRGRPPKVRPAEEAPAAVVEAPVETAVEETAVQEADLVQEQAPTAEPIPEQVPGGEVTSAPETAETSSEVVSEAASDSNTVAEGEEDQSEAARASQAPRTSIFGNLNKPVNEPAAS